MIRATLAGLIVLLNRNRNEPDFFESVRQQMGEFKSWEDEGDVFLTGSVKGVEILIGHSGSVDSIFLFGLESTEGLEHAGDLPLGLNFDQSRKEVRALLGKPITSGEGGTFFGEVVFPWDKFEFPDYVIHVRYKCNENGINRITLERPGTV